jgi:glutathione S-transferase
MALEVFWGSGSGPAWRVLLALAVKKVPFTSHVLSFSKGEHKSPEMLAMNPRGKVPVVRDGDFVLYESLAILAYLDRKYPSPPLFGETPEDAGRVMQAIMEHESYALTAISAFARPLLFERLDVQRDQCVLAIDGARAELEKLEATLAARPWLALTTMSAADLVVFPQIKTLERALGKPGAATVEHGLGPIVTVFPAIDAWCKRIEALPGYDATYPPHWRG